MGGYFSSSSLIHDARAQSSPSPERQYQKVWRIAEAQGDRPSMEDQALHYESIKTKWSALAVLDGHGGEMAALLLAKRLLPEALENVMIVLDQETRHSSIRKILEEWTIKLDETLRGLLNDQSGCTLAMVLFHPLLDCIICLHVGDSRIAIFDALNKKCCFESKDHKPNQSAERKRILASGYHVTHQGTRVGHPINPVALSLSRAMGDYAFKRKWSQDSKTCVLDVVDAGISCRPDIAILPLQTYTSVMILIGCDGMFDCLTSQQILSEIDSSKNITGAIKKAYRSGSTDNMTLIACNLTKRVTDPLIKTKDDEKTCSGLQ